MECVYSRSKHGWLVSGRVTSRPRPGLVCICLIICFIGFVQSETSIPKGVFCGSAAASCKLFIQPLVEDEESGRETGAVLGAKIVISLLPYNNTCLDALI